MTIQQLQYVIEIVRTGSVSRAARNLYISQPTLSNSIMKLEQELGFQIFFRTAQGMELTELGEKFTKRIGKILYELNDLMGDVNQNHIGYFQLYSGSYIPAFEAFQELCTKYQDQSDILFSCFTDPNSNLIQSLKNGQYDLAVYTGISNFDMDEFCKLSDTRYTNLVDTSLYIQISKDHPLIKNDQFSFDKLSDYPFVDYLGDGKGIFADDKRFRFVNPSKMIRIQSFSGRKDIVKSSNAFSIVLPHSKEFNKDNHLAYFKIPDTDCSIGYLLPNNRSVSIYTEYYLQLLKNKIQNLEFK